MGCSGAESGNSDKRTAWLRNPSAQEIKTAERAARRRSRIEQRSLPHRHGATARTFGICGPRRDPTLRHPHLRLLYGVPDAEGVFHGCVNKQNGRLRLVLSASSCRAVKERHGRIIDRGWFAIAGNAQGQPGTAGQLGRPGPGVRPVRVVQPVPVASRTKWCERPATIHCLAAAAVGGNAGEHAISGGAQGQEGDGIAQSVPNPPTAGGTPARWAGQSRDTAGRRSASVDVFGVCASPKAVRDSAG